MKLLDKLLKISVISLISSVFISISLAEILFGINLILWIVKLIKGREFITIGNKIDILILCFLSLRFISCFYAPDITLSLRHFLKSWTFIVIYLILNNLHTVRDIKHMIYALLICTDISALYGIFNYILTKPAHGHAVGFYGGWGVFTCNLTTTVAIVLGLILYYVKRLKIKIFLMATLLILLSGVFLAMERSGWLAVGSILFLSVILSKKIKKLTKLILPLTMIIFILFLGILKFSREIVISRLQQTLNLDASGRWQLWTYSLQKIKQRPILGYGIASFKPESKEAAIKSQVPSIWSSCHNDYIQVAFENGILGLIIFLLLIVRIIQSGFKILQKFNDRDFEKGLTFGILLAIISWIVINCFSNNLGTEMVMCLILGLIGVLFKLNKTKPNQKTN